MKNIFIFLSLAFAALSLNGCIIAEKYAINVRLEEDGSGVAEVTGFDLRSNSANEYDIKKDVDALTIFFYGDDDALKNFVYKNGYFISRGLSIDDGKVNCKVLYGIKNISDMDIIEDKDGSLYTKIPQQGITSENGIVTPDGTGYIVRWKAGEKNLKIEISSGATELDSLKDITSFVKPAIDEALIKGRRN